MKNNGGFDEIVFSQFLTRFSFIKKFTEIYSGIYLSVAGLQKSILGCGDGAVFCMFFYNSIN
ncbi:hypothetical protein VSA01S_10510 [Vibrio sagamiensis NBRC 104589]|uniref:Uncharacterized protein n=1 Tax=Vibrio sagamiensis NBRC 104589 TaxID=1219064 RepID=A0A511QCB8_9VIBR|nr:hypothetical protein VSA01S_10510 [Vibrio sagamiensis NBRC 104589]